MPNPANDNAADVAMLLLSLVRGSLAPPLSRRGRSGEQQPPFPPNPTRRAHVLDALRRQAPAGRPACLLLLGVHGTAPHPAHQQATAGRTRPLGRPGPFRSGSRVPQRERAPARLHRS
jgi:hypothetical protein